MKISLRTCLVVLLLMATVPVAALMCYQLLRQVRAEEAARRQDLQRESQVLAEAVDNELIASIDALRILALSDALRRGDVREFERSVAARGPLRAGWQGSFLTDARGTVLFDTTGAARKGMQVQVFGVRRMLVGRTPLVSGLLAQGQDGRAATVIAVPVLVDGEVRYALGVWMPWAAWQLLLKRAISSDLAYASLYDADQRVIADATAPQHLVGHVLAAQPLGAQASYGAAQTVPTSGWGVRLGIAAAPVAAAQLRSIGAAWATAAGCLLLGVTLALLVARRVTRPLTLMAHQGGAVSLGPIHVREIALLRDALLAARERDQAARDGLRRKADEFETLFNSSPIGLSFAQDRECSNVLHNAAMGHLFGPFGADSPRGPGAYHRGELVSREKTPLCTAARTGQAVAMTELEFRPPGRPVIHAIANAVPLRDANGRPRGAIGAMVDITALKAAEAQWHHAESQWRESQRLLELAQEAGHVGFFHYQFGDDALTWTPGQAKLFGLDRGGFESSLTQWLAQIHAEDRGAMESTLLRALAVRQEIVNLEYRVLVNAGPEGGEGQAAALRWLASRLSLSYGEDGDPQRMVGVTLDITDRKRIEQAAAQLMEREQSARRQAESANRAKDEFLAMLGHELRNPLSAISSAVEVLQRCEGHDAPASREMATSAREVIARQTRHLAHMMGDLLDVTRVISGKVLLSRQPLDLAALARRALDTLALTGATARHTLVSDLQEVWVQADATRIEQVVINLVGNALKYTPPGRQVGVALHAEDDEAVLLVSDDGDGIPPELLPRVFDLFVQGERSLDRSGGGLGIGLTLVKRLVDLHGGTVAATSSSRGSRFEVRLPRVAPVALPDADRGAMQPRQRRVLVIEDNADALRALADLLALDGHTVSTAADGRLGLEALRRDWPDVAIVDIGLPLLDGLQLAQMARACGYPGTLIALSGYGQEHDAQGALKAGFDAHLVKPVGPDELRALMREARAVREDG